MDAKTRERMLLVTNVAWNGLMAAKVARDLLYRSKDWAVNG